MTEPVEVAMMLAARGDAGAMEAFAVQLVEDVTPELERATGRSWRFRQFAAQPRSAEGNRRPTDFLDEAAMRMASGPYDLVVVLTDGPLVARHLTVGAASSVARMVVMSTWKLRAGPREEPQRELSSQAVRWNAASLLLHLLGHLLGRRRRDDEAVQGWRFDAERRDVPTFGPRTDRRLQRTAARFPDRAIMGGGRWRQLLFHLRSAAGNPYQVVQPMLRSRAPLLPLALPRLSTAAVVPVFVLIFSAEIWDVGLHMHPATALLSALAAVLASSLYLVFATGLLFPRGERDRLTEHLAVVNVAVVLTMTAAMVGLLLLLTGLILLIIGVLFPADLGHRWATTEGTVTTFSEMLRVALFIATLGTVTGALAGGLEDRMVVRQLSLFGEQT